MKLAILSQGRMLYSTRRLAEAGRKRGHDVRVINPTQVVLTMHDGELGARREGLRTDDYDCVIPRIGASLSDFGIALLQQLEMLGVRTLNSAEGLRICGDKLRSMQALSALGVPVPHTALTRDSQSIGELVEAMGGTPVILKLLRGTQGVGVIKVDTLESAESTLQALWSLKQDVLIQEFVGEAQGADIRAFVVDGHVAGAMERRARDGEFRSNLHRGGAVRKVDLDADYEQIAIEAAEGLGLRVAGVDLLVSRRGPLVLEVNGSPGLEGIEQATGRDIARAVIECAERCGD